MTVVYEDNHIIVVNKTASEIVQADKTGDTPLSEAVKQYLSLQTVSLRSWRGTTSPLLIHNSLSVANSVLPSVFSLQPRKLST